MRYHDPSPDPTPPTTPRPVQERHRTPPRDYIGRLFAAALDGDPVASEELTDLAPWDAGAAAAFEALAVAEFVRDVGSR